MLLNSYDDHLQEYYQVEASVCACKARKIVSEELPATIHRGTVHGRPGLVRSVAIVVRLVPGSGVRGLSTLQGRREGERGGGGKEGGREGKRGRGEGGREGGREGGKGGREGRREGGRERFQQNCNQIT